MSNASPPADEPPEHRGPGRALGVLALMLALAAGGWFLVEKLSADSALQDCVMAGRGNCAPLDPTPSLPSSSTPR